MASQDPESVAQTLVAEGKGILAADETIPTLTRRFDTLGIQSTEKSRRTYREMLFTSPGAAQFISGVIMYDETIRQKSSGGVPLTATGIVFLSGGQNARLATAHLNAINRLPGPKPWKISFSYGRALQDPALEAWHGRDENLVAGQNALYRRANCNGAASVGKYTDEMKLESVSTDDPPHRRDWRDD